MNKIQKNFENKAIIPYIMGGDPNIQTTEKIILQMSKCGASAIKIGIPFSDPSSESPNIQASHLRALKSKTNIYCLFEMIKKVRKDIEIPILFMTYVNPIFVYGIENFTNDCAKYGVDGIIVLDVPLEEKEEVSIACEKSNITFIQTVSPTSTERIKKITSQAKGFLYCIPAPVTSITSGNLTSNISELVNSIRNVSDINCIVSGSIHTKEQAKEILKIADGVVLSNEISDIISMYGNDSVEKVEKFVKDIAF